MHNIWGSSAWYFLHASTFAYPDTPCDEDRKATFQFLTSLPFMLPCEECREHAFAYINIDKFTRIDSPDSAYLDDRNSFAKWMYDFHNAVNIRIGNNVHNRSFTDVKKYYESQPTCGNPNNLCQVRKKLPYQIVFKKIRGSNQVLPCTIIIAVFAIIIVVLMCCYLFRHRTMHMNASKRICHSN